MLSHCLPPAFSWRDRPVPFCHAVTPANSRLCTQPGISTSTHSTSTSTDFPALPLKATITTTKVKREGRGTTSVSERIMWKRLPVSGWMLVSVYGKTENFCEKEWRLQNKCSSLTILPPKCFKIPSSRLAQTISIMHLMCLHFPSTSIGMLQALQLHLNEFMKWENSDKILAYMKQKGKGRQWGEE